MSEFYQEMVYETRQADPCKAMEAHRDGRGLWAFRACYLPGGHKQRHAFGLWNMTDAVSVLSQELYGKEKTEDCAS